MTTPRQSRQPAKTVEPAAPPSTPPIRHAALWFSQARLGAEFHWGPAAELGLGENALFHHSMPLAEYRKRAEHWEPSAFDAQAWAEAARAAGVRYVIFPARGSDGFCLWRTATTSFCSVHHGEGRDFLAEFTAAAREAGLRVGVSVALADWSDETCLTGPGRASQTAWATLTAKIHRQVREVLEGYGPLDLVQLTEPGGFSASQWQATALVKMIRDLQPDALLSYTWVNTVDWPEADIATIARPDFKRPGLWQSSAQPYPEITEHGWRAEMSRPEACAKEAALLDQLVNSAMAGGNLLLHISPDGRGLWPVPLRGALHELGRWLGAHGESIYGTVRVRYQTGLRHTRRGRVLYLHFADRAAWSWDAARGEYAFTGVREQVHGAFLVGSKRRLGCDWSAPGTARVRGLPEPGSPDWARPGGVVGLRLAPE